MSDRTGNQWQTICLFEELAPEKFMEFRLHQKNPEPDTLPLTGFLFLDGGEPKAFVNQCPHLGIELNWMPGRFMDADNLFIQCSTHGALFKPGSGECIAGPCQGDALTALDLRVQGDAIQVRLPE